MELIWDHSSFMKILFGQRPERKEHSRQPGNDLHFFLNRVTQLTNVFNLNHDMVTAL